MNIRLLKRTLPIFLISFFLFQQNAQSQVIISLLFGEKLNSPNLEFGLEGGFNRSWMSGIEEAKGDNNFHLGFYFDIRLKKNWWVNTGVRVKSNIRATNITPYDTGDDNLDSVFSSGYITRNIPIFYVPAHIKYRFAKQFFIMGGFQIGLRHQAVDHFINTFYDKDDTEFRLDIDEMVTRFDFGLSGGVGYKFKGTGMNLGMTYYYGLVDVLKTDVESMASSLYIHVDIPIGAGYKEKKAEKEDKAD